MLTRIRRSVADASSLISPFGKTHRRIAVSTSRKSPTLPASALNNGNFAASSRNCPRSHPAVSSSDAASNNSAASSTTPVPSIFANHNSGSASPPNPNSFPLRSHSRASLISANSPRKYSRSSENSSPSTTRRPGAHVVLCRSNSRSFSNSSTSCALRLIPAELSRLRLTSSFLYFFTSLFLYLITSLFLATRRSRGIKLLDHGYTQRIQSIRRFMPLRSHVVAHERKQQSSPARQIRVSRPGPHVLHRSSLGMHPRRGNAVLHAVFQRAVGSRHRQ